MIDGADLVYIITTALLCLGLVFVVGPPKR